MNRQERISKAWHDKKIKEGGGPMLDLEGFQSLMYFIYKNELKERGRNYKPVPLDEWLTKGYQSKDNAAIHAEMGDM